MLKNTGVELIHSIERYTPDAKNKFISVEIATGSIIDEVFVSDGRGLIKHRIANEPDQTLQKTDQLIIDAVGQVTLSRVPIDNNQIEVNGAAQDHVSGQLVDCNGFIEGDEVAVSYYYFHQGRQWFDENAAFVADDHAEYAGLNDYEYNSKRLWSILLEMDLVNGAIV